MSWSSAKVGTRSSTADPSSRTRFDGVGAHGRPKVSVAPSCAGSTLLAADPNRQGASIWTSNSRTDVPERSDAVGRLTLPLRQAGHRADRYRPRGSAVGARAG